jgi:hypothetical protein
MRTTTPPTNRSLSGQQCHDEIPPSVALSPEGADLVDFHCGTGCYESFVAQVRTESIKDAMILAAPLM